jgi:hypothetical protein
MTRYRRARATPLPREQRRAAGVGVAGDRVSVADGRDRGEAGPGGSGRGVREKRERGRAAAGRRGSNQI